MACCTILYGVLYCFVCVFQRWGLVNESHGHWIEIVDPTGETTGIVGGSTLYYNRETEETRFKKPPGWVRLRAESIVSRAKQHEDRATSRGKSAGSGVGGRILSRVQEDPTRAPSL